MTLTNVAKLRQGFDRITFEEFCDLLMPNTISSKDPNEETYAFSKWKGFQTNPIDFLSGWGSRRRAEDLFSLAVQKAGIDA